MNLSVLVLVGFFFVGAFSCLKFYQNNLEIAHLSFACSACVVAVLFSLGVGVARAEMPEVYISEIMFNPSGADAGYEWIEIYNPTQNKVYLSDLFFVENDTRHKIKSDTIEYVASGEYLVVADDFEKLSSVYVGVKIADSAFSLKNTGEPLSLEDGSGSVLFSIDYGNYMTGESEGLSLQYDDAGGAYYYGLPTPGTSGAGFGGGDSGSGGEQSGDDNDNSDNGRGGEEISTKSFFEDRGDLINEYRVSLSPNSYYVSGEPAKILLSIEKKNDYGVYRPAKRGYADLGYGDGDGERIYLKDFKQNYVEHVYGMPGDYVMTVKYYLNEFSEEPDIEIGADVKVIVSPFEVIIEDDVAGLKKLYLRNITAGSADAEGWKVDYGVGVKRFANTTIVPALSSVPIVLSASVPYAILYAPSGRAVLASGYGLPVYEGADDVKFAKVSFRSGESVGGSGTLADDGNARGGGEEGRLSEDASSVKYASAWEYDAVKRGNWIKILTGCVILLSVGGIIYGNFASAREREKDEGSPAESDEVFEFNGEWPE